MKVVLEADAPRVKCRKHGVVAAVVPWARHGAGHTGVFDQQVAWMAAECSKSAVAQVMRILWRRVEAIVERFVADRDAGVDRLAGLRRIGTPEDLTGRQQAKFTWIASTDPRLHRAYLLKEGLRTVFAIAGEQGSEAAVEALDRWLSWARRCRIEVFTDLARRVRRHRDAIVNAIIERLSNGLIESTNIKTRLIIRRGFGFRTADAVIALVMLTVGGNRPTLPGRQLASK